CPGPGRRRAARRLPEATQAVTSQGGTVEDRLAQLGLTLPAVVAPLAAYVPAVRTGNLVWSAGQLPFVDGELGVTGKVGAGIEPDAAKELARICALNALAAVTTEIGDLDRVRRVVKGVGYVARAPSF